MEPQTPSLIASATVYLGDKALLRSSVAKRPGFGFAARIWVPAFLLLTLAACSQPSEPEVRAYVDEAIGGLGDGYYADSPVWDAEVKKALPMLYAAQSIPETHRTLSALTKVAGGRHSFFSTPSETAHWGEPYPAGAVPVPEVAYDGSVAILTVPGFSSDLQSEIDQYLDASAELFSTERATHACGWIIDLSTNAGGDMRAMLVAVSPLLDDGVVMTLSDRDGSVSSVDVVGTTVAWGGVDWGSLPERVPKVKDRPIAIVQSADSASAAESLILAFAGQESTATYGVETAGYTTVNDGFRLPDGSVVTLSFALMGDRNQNFHEGSLEPTYAVSQSPESAREAALGSIVRQCARP